LTVSTLSTGTSAIVAFYSGDATFVSTSSAPLTQRVGPLVGSNTHLTTNLNPSAVGQPVTFKATVTPVNGAANPTGTVTFHDGAAAIGSRQLVTLAGGPPTATLTLINLAPGAHTITATFNGDSNFSSSTSPSVAQTVGTIVGTVTGITASANPTGFGSAVSFTASVQPVAATSLTPSGSVSFSDGAVPLGTATLN